MSVFIFLLCGAFVAPQIPPTGLQQPLSDLHACAAEHQASFEVGQPRLPERIKTWLEEQHQPKMISRKSGLTVAQLAALDGADFVNAIASCTDQDLYPLWTFDSNVAVIVSPSRVGLIANALQSELNGDPARLAQFIYYFQIAFYHEFYQASVTYDQNLKDQAGFAVASVGDRADFLSETDAAMVNLRFKWGVTVDSIDVTIDVLDHVEDLLIRFGNNSNLETDYYERKLAWDLLNSLWRQVLLNSSLTTQSPWYNAIPTSLINVLRDLALEPNYEPNDIGFVVETAIFALGHFNVLNPATKAAAHGIVSDAYRQHVQFSGPWLRAVTDLETFYNETLDDATVVDTDGIRDQLRAQLLPNEYSFEEGRITFRTALSEQEAKELVDAMAEVRAQFFRKTTFIDAVPNDPNEYLTMIIYASPEDYQDYQYFLYGYNTNNGGIYIEVDGTFFTFDRDETVYTLTLEELTRHEYVHYLDARYAINGGYYESDIYLNNRLTWYNEGFAEWLTGSTRNNGVLPRENYVADIGNDQTRMTIAEFIGIAYGNSFKFYRYSGLFFTFLDQNHPDLLLQLFDLVRGDDPAQLDAFTSQLEADANLQAGYDNYINARLTDIQNGTGLFAEDVGTVYTPSVLPSNNLASIQSTLQSVLSVSSITDVETRYRAFGALSTSYSGQSETAIQDQFEAQLDQVLVNLQAQGNNFVSAVAYFGNIAVNGGSATAELVVEGPYQGVGSGTQPPATPSGVTATASGNAVLLSWNANAETNLSGYRIYRSTTAGGPYSWLAETSSTNSTSSTSYNDAGLAAGSYFYRVSAFNGAGESYASPEVSAVVQATSRAAWHRYFNAVMGNHFYTTDFSVFGNGSGDFSYEGIQGYVETSQVPGSVPFYRYFNAGIGDHFYTTDFSIFGNGDQNWTYEGVQAYVYPTQVTGSVALYRYWNAAIGDHFYTTDFSTFGSGNGTWVYEGVACYIWDTP